MAEEMISKERIDYTIDLLITMAVEEIAEDTGKSPKEILPEFYSSKTGKALYDEQTRLWCNGPSYIAELYWTNSPKERFEKKLFLTYYAFETAFLINRPPGTKAPSFLSILSSFFSVHSWRCAHL